MSVLRIQVGQEDAAEALPVLNQSYFAFIKLKEYFTLAATMSFGSDLLGDILQGFS